MRHKQVQVIVRTPITMVIRMNDKVERLSLTMKSQQEKIENLTERVIRLETALEIAISGRMPKKSARQIE